MAKRQLKPFSLNHLNAWRMHRQWLDRPHPGKDIVKLVREVGWIHAPGCSTPYLSLWARMPALRPQSLDRAVFNQRKLIPLETLRGTPMLVPQDQVAIALRVRSRTFTELAEQAQEMIPMSPGEMGRLKDHVLSALESGSKSESEIEGAVPSALVREFPSTLRRIGMTGSVRLAISLLSEEGRIVKVPTVRRLDTDAHGFALLSELLPEVDPYELKPELASAALARVYFKTEGPARIKDFAWWSGLHVTEAMRAVETLRPALAPIQIAGSRDEFLMAESDLDPMAGFKSDSSPVVSFIPYRDIYLKGQREIGSRFLDPEHAHKPFSRIGSRLSTDPLPAILCDGKVIGIWEWNADGAGKVDFLLFDSGTPARVQDLVRKHAARLQAFVSENLGSVQLRSNGFGRGFVTEIHDLKTAWGGEVARTNASTA
jgi:hypothetical protein